uniref:PLAC domain-containing protein n=1 Tax=Panagrolaimus davidi TaxID=227884 RepID=A0A914QDT3_9BILA
MKHIVKMILLYFLPVTFGTTGKVATWAGDITGPTCPDHAKCDPGGGMLCSAPMMKCNCTERPGYLTSSSGLFKQICNWSNIDGKPITAADRDRCLNCEKLVCDSPDYPWCPTNCGNPICINGVQTFEMDACPSNHQKNVAKCCMWGGDYCSCIDGNWIDVNAAAMNALGCSGLCQNATWQSGQNCPQQSGCGTSCNDVPPPTSAQYTCEQQRQWGKCNETWMTGYCCKSCANSQLCCNDIPEPGGYTCQQQHDWGKCDEPWMNGYCRHTCGKC